jgi:hypothetical protein
MEAAVECLVRSHHGSVKEEEDLKEEWKAEAEVSFVYNAFLFIRHKYFQATPEISSLRAEIVAQWTFYLKCFDFDCSFSCTGAETKALYLYANGMRSSKRRTANFKPGQEQEAKRVR